jgi:hypothetical protein
MEGKVLAVCLKTYVDEDDMVEYCEGKITKPCQVKIYHKSKKYWVVAQYVNQEYYKIPNETTSPPKEAKDS